MHLTFRNVNDAFKGLVEGFHKGSIPTRRSPSRVGEVLVVEEPMTITYQKPLERVLFNQARDCNPFFHAYESLWMLSGRNDVEPLKYYSSKIGDIASDDGKTFNGAYGYRWRHAKTTGPRRDGTDLLEKLPDGCYVPRKDGYCFDDAKNNGVDQLQVIINHLKRVPGSRRAVLQMWNIEDDLLKLESTKDVCCNLSVLFSLRKADYQKSIGGGFEFEKRVGNWLLDMTVTNRSNDMIWGLTGANVVHFSFLLEYMAACIGVEVGVYNQFTNNLHVYTENNGGFHPDKWLNDKTQSVYGTVLKDIPWTTVSLVRDPVMFDREVCEFVELNKNDQDIFGTIEWNEPFLNLVAQPMCHAYHTYKVKDFESALYWCSKIPADDWRVACTNWMLKRKTNHEKKQEVRE